MCHAFHRFKSNLSLLCGLTPCNELGNEFVNHAHNVRSPGAFRMPYHSTVTTSANPPPAKGKAVVVAVALTETLSHILFLAPHPTSFHFPRSSRIGPTTSFPLGQHLRSLAYWLHMDKNQACRVNNIQTSVAAELTGVISSVYHEPGISTSDSAASVVPTSGCCGSGVGIIQLLAFLL